MLLHKLAWILVIVLIILSLGFIGVEISSGSVFDVWFDKSNYNMCGPFWGELFQ